MFGIFKRKQSFEDPLSDLHTVTRWMLELPAGDIRSAQEHVIQRLIKFNRGPSPMTLDRLKALMYLDEHAREMHQSLFKTYLRNPHMPRAVESRLWTTIRAFNWEVTRGYHAFVMDYVADSRASQIKAWVPLVTARSLRGLADIIKCSHLRYEPVDGKLWLKLHNLYRIAEIDCYLSDELKVYKDDQRDSTCLAEYVQPLLLSAQADGSLTPRQIDMVDQWLDDWSHSVRVERIFNPQLHHFQVDTSQERGLQRIRSEHGDSCRFLNLSSLANHLVSVRRNLKSGALPASLGLGEEFRLPDGYVLLERVTNAWLPMPGRDRRVSPRKVEAGRRQFIRDLGNISKYLNVMLESPTDKPLLSDEEILDIKLYGFVTEHSRARARQKVKRVDQLALVEHWAMRDFSESGMGVMIQADECDWIKVGKLLAFRPDAAAPWQIGVIRRIRRENDTYLAGVEVICKRAEVVQIETEQPISLSYSSEGDGSTLEFDQSHYALRFTESSTDFLIMSAATYTRGAKFRMRTRQSVHPIRLEVVLDRGDDWLVASLQLLG